MYVMQNTLIERTLTMTLSYISEGTLVQILEKGTLFPNKELFVHLNNFENPIKIFHCI